MPIDTSRPNRNFVWGVPAIANLINRTVKQTYPLVLQGRIAGVRKVNGRYVGYVPKVLAQHGALDAIADDAADGDDAQVNGGA